MKQCYQVWSVKRSRWIGLPHQPACLHGKRLAEIKQRVAIAETELMAAIIEEKRRIYDGQPTAAQIRSLVMAEVGG